MIDHPNDDQRRALAYLRRYRNQHGHGPAWSELERDLDWPKNEISVRLKTLAPYGVTWQRRVPRSLRITNTRQET